MTGDTRTALLIRIGQLELALRQIASSTTDPLTARIARQAIGPLSLEEQAREQRGIVGRDPVVPR